MKQALYGWVFIDGVRVGVKCIAYDPANGEITVEGMDQPARKVIRSLTAVSRIKGSKGNRWRQWVLPHFSRRQLLALPHRAPEGAPQQRRV